MAAVPRAVIIDWGDQYIFGVIASSEATRQSSCAPAGALGNAIGVALGKLLFLGALMRAAGLLRFARNDGHQ
jgi:hypothetical protein